MIGDERKQFAYNKGYEQGEPGWYIYNVATRYVVLVIDDQVPLQEDEVADLTYFYNTKDD